MSAKPIPAFWRGAVSSFGSSVWRPGSLTEWLARTWKWRPSLLAEWRSGILSFSQHAEADVQTVIDQPATAPSTEQTRAGGMLMMFRKDNNPRSDSFQRQVTSLRKQAQTDDDLGTDEYRYDEPQDTSQFATAAPAQRDEEYAASRTSSEELAQTQSIAQAQPAYRASWQTSDAATSVVSSNSNWNGILRTEGSINVHGRAEGELHAANDVFVAEGAEVDAHIFADNVVVAGTVRGKVEARGRLELLAQGHVSGDVKAPRLIVHEGAQLSGQLKMESGGTTSTYSTDAGTTTGRRSSR
jgi:cytoskeletal protein CcmA (bactofilin family)